MNEEVQSQLQYLEDMLEKHSGSVKIWKFFSFVLGIGYAAFLLFNSEDFSSSQVGVLSACSFISMIYFISQWQRAAGAIDRIKQEMRDLLSRT